MQGAREIVEWVGHLSCMPPPPWVQSLIPYMVPRTPAGVMIPEDCWVRPKTKQKRIQSQRGLADNGMLSGGAPEVTCLWGCLGRAGVVGVGTEPPPQPPHHPGAPLTRLQKEQRAEESPRARRKQKEKFPRALYCSLCWLSGRLQASGQSLHSSNLAPRDEPMKLDLWHPTTSKHCGEWPAGPGWPNARKTKD